MKTPENSLAAFFDSYARANDQNDLTVIADFYAENFIAGGPNGNSAFKNDQTFIKWLQQLQEFNRETGMEQMHIVDYKETPISEDYTMTSIKWGARFHKTGKELITFDISYFLYIKTTPKIVMYISHLDQEELMKEKGLL